MMYKENKVYLMYVYNCVEGRIVVFLNERTKQLLESTIGKSIAEISDMSFDEEIAYAAEKYGKAPIFSKKADKRMTGRGNPLIARKRICTMEDIDRRIMELK